MGTQTNLKTHQRCQLSCEPQMHTIEQIARLLQFSEFVLPGGELLVSTHEYVALIMQQPQSVLIFRI